MSYCVTKHYAMQKRLKHHVAASKDKIAKHFLVDQNMITVIRLYGGAHAEMEAWLSNHGATPHEDSYSYFREFTVDENLQVLFLLRWG
jgi:hypothetical protein